MITAVLLSWKRPANMTPIVESLRASEHVKEIMLWNNSPDEKLVTLWGDVTIINSPRNFSTLARYAFAILASWDVFWFQDDDILITPEQLDKVVQEYKTNQIGDGRIYGVRGRRLNSDGTYSSKMAYEDCDILVHAHLLHRRLLTKLFEYLPSPHRPEPGTLDDAEDDILLHAGQRFRPFAVNVEPITQLAGYADPAMARFRRKDHGPRRNEALAHVWRVDRGVR